MMRTLLMASLSLLVVAAIIMSPGEAFQASLQGLTVWWNIVFPGLLPFLTLFELMLAFGAVHGLGALLDPLMRRLFKLPGEAGLAVAFGWGGGFPAGADATAQLRKRAAVSKSEGERLLALSHMPNPLFVLIVVGSGFLHQPELGIAILLAIWVSGLFAGFIMGLGSGNRNLQSAETVQQGILRRAAIAMSEARKKDGRTLGKVLGDSVSASVAKLMAVGGFMMLGAVAVSLLSPLLKSFVPPMLLPVLIESHIGAYAAATAELPGGPWIAAAIAGALSFGGITALLQAGSSIAGTDLSLRRLMVSRVLQPVLAFGFALFTVLPIASFFRSLAASTAPAMYQSNWWPASAIIRSSELPNLWGSSFVLLLIFTAAVVMLSFFSYGTSRLSKK
ncbi:sporulation integral membrane protein YlbJ [Paenibacillus phyllosphaerae]|uniref:Sporulation integral membrane protein YlbJ n=1 Tax=Paenibacillus phyllosphaerae TaxID=274593 RepID=A0A7W5FLS7_9BACL|nr:nucleoside recognition domain-containing protein [Paenibacillus phyllosphaerae]MBB3109347.1 sporulation integral membrane protein YlbJ [Paenibacillus phyllosphaerae]